MTKEPWKELKVSKATYYRQKSQGGDLKSHETKKVSHENETTNETKELPIDLRFCEVTRADVERLGIPKPNWYRAGYKSKREVLNQFSL